MKKLFLFLTMLSIPTICFAGTNQTFAGRITTSYTNSAVSYNVATGGGGLAWTATEGDVDVPVPGNFVAKNLRVSIPTAPGSGKSVAIALRKNGAATGITCTVSDTATSCVDTTHTAQFVSGDLIALEATPTGTPTASSVVYSWQAQIAKANTNYYMSVGSSGMTTNATEKYMKIEGVGTWIASASEDTSMPAIVSTVGTFSNLKINLQSPPGSGKSLTFTLRRGVLDGAFAATAITCTISNLETSCEDTTHTITTSVGDRLTIGGVGGSSGTTASISTHTLKFSPLNDGESMLFFNSSNSPSVSATNYHTAAGIYTGSSWSSSDSTSINIPISATDVIGLQAYCTTDAGAAASGKSYEITLRNTAADTLLSATLFEDVNYASDEAVVSLTDGQTLSLKSVPTGTPASTTIAVGILVDSEYSTRTTLY